MDKFLSFAGGLGRTVLAMRSEMSRYDERVTVMEEQIGELLQQTTKHHDRVIAMEETMIEMQQQMTKHHEKMTRDHAQLINMVLRG